jgi:hypothetical protein
MKLLIQVENGVAVGHPIFEDNFCQAFPDIDINNLPSSFAVFERVEIPNVHPYEVYEGATYEKFGGVFKDVHHIRLMTDVEKAEKIAEAKLRRHPEGWIFNEDACEWQPPQE